MKLQPHHYVIIILLVICSVMLYKNVAVRAMPAGEAKPVDSADKNEKNEDKNMVLENIYSRKSVRHFTDKAVTKEQLTELMKAGMAAPTAANRQPWAFVAVTDRKVLDALAEKLPYAGMLKQANSAVVVVGMPKMSLEGKESEYWIQDCSAATQNILLAAESMGLGAVWTGVYPVEERVVAVREILSIPADAVPLNVIAIGYPTGVDKPKDKFKAERIHWEKW